MPVNMNLAALYMNENGEYKPIPGVRGEPGVTPTISVEDIPGGHRVTIAGAEGSTSIDVMDGTNGVSPTVAVTDVTGGHRVTITDAIGTRSFDVMDGAAGSDGAPGAAGVSPTVAVTDITGGHRVTITDAIGTRSFDVMDGATGAPGAPGAAGVSPTVAVTDVTGGHRVTITDATGSRSFDVMDGTDGSTPVLTVIHITGSSPNFVSDVSYADAMTAYNNGSLLYAVRNDAVYGLYRVEASRLLFARTYIANNTVAIDTVSFTSTGAIGLGNQIVHPPKMLTFSLTSNGSDAYADPPTGTLGVEISDIDDISYAYHAAAGTSDDYVILGLRNGAPGSTPPDPYEMYSIQSATWDEETGPETVATLTFRCVGFRTGVPVIKTITVSDTPWTYDSFENAVVSFSETALAVSP